MKSPDPRRVLDKKESPTTDVGQFLAMLTKEKLKEFLWELG